MNTTRMTINRDNIDAIASAYHRPSDMDASNDAILRSHAQLRADLDKATERQVRFARDMGRSWAQIGAALGISKQAAWEKYREIGTGPMTTEND